MAEPTAGPDKSIASKVADTMSKTCGCGRRECRSDAEAITETVLTVLDHLGYEVRPKPGTLS